MTTIGFIGSGNIGSTLAKLAVDHGYNVVMSNSRGPETLEGLAADLGPHARAERADEAARLADIAVVTIPLQAYRDVPVDALAGKVVIDTNNYYPQRDGSFPELDAEQTTSSELLQAHLPESHVVKAFNHIHVKDLATQGQPEGTPGRRALAVAGDDAGARQQVAMLINDFGFDVVDVGPLAEGWRYQRDTEAYVDRYDADGLRAALGNAKRYRDM